MVAVEPPAVQVPAVLFGETIRLLAARARLGLQQSPQPLHPLAGLSLYPLQVVLAVGRHPLAALPPRLGVAPALLGLLGVALGWAPVTEDLEELLGGQRRARDLGGQRVLDRRDHGLQPVHPLREKRALAA